VSKPNTEYGAVQNLVNGLGTSFSKSRQWVPRHSPNKRTRSRLRTLYQETIGSMVVDLVVDGVASGRPIGILDEDLSTYRAISKKLRQAWKLGRLYGYAWIDHLWGVHHIGNSVPDCNEVLVSFNGIEDVWHDKHTNVYQRYESVLVAPYSDICLYEACKTSAFETVGEFALLTMQIPNMLESAKDCKFVDSMRSLSQVKATTGIITLSDGSSFDLHHYQYDQIIKLIEAAENAISATSRIPKAILFQRSPQGATSGRFEIVRWYETLQQESEVWIDAVNVMMSNMQLKSRLEDMAFDHLLQLYGLGLPGDQLTE
jgi:hypothetical protein